LFFVRIARLGRSRMWKVTDELRTVHDHASVADDTDPEHRAGVPVPTRSSAERSA
jgi:hypothetical protein